MPPNVLLVVVDALRADHAPPDGAAETPALDEFADEATVFERAVSPAPWTLPSVTSLLTGRYPHEHGATSRHHELRLGRTLQADLSDAGYRCVHVSPTTWIGEWLPQGRGFDEVTEFTGSTHRYLDRGADVRRLSGGVADGPGWYATVLKRALRDDAPLSSLVNVAAYKADEARGSHWLDRRASDDAAAAVDEHLAALADADDPFFCYVHLMDPHLPFLVPDAFRSDVRPPGYDAFADEREYFDALLEDVWALRLGERRLTDAEVAYLRARYRDAVAYVDRVVGRMFDALDRRGDREETLVAVTADHGEHLGEGDGRTLVDHQTSVRLPVLHVPLLVRLPGTFDHERRSDLVQPHYLADTVRALAGLDHDPSRSLLAADADGRRDVADADARRDAAVADAPRDVAVAEYAGVVRSHPPDRYADADELFAPRRTAVLGDWKLDAVGDRRRAVRVDWRANEARTVPVDSVPDDVRRRLTTALPDVPASGAEDDASGDDLPGDVAARLEDLGYR